MRHRAVADLVGGLTTIDALIESRDSRIQSGKQRLATVFNRFSRGITAQEVSASLVGSAPTYINRIPTASLESLMQSSGYALIEDRDLKAAVHQLFVVIALHDDVVDRLRQSEETFRTHIEEYADLPWMFEGPARAVGGTSDLGVDLEVQRNDPDPQAFVRSRKFMNSLYQRIVWRDFLSVRGARVREFASCLL